jgi:transcriptional regulator of NAD metabolism
MTNIDLAEKFKVETNIIAQYKSRLRKIGVKLPLLKRTSLIADAVNDK